MYTSPRAYLRQITRPWILVTAALGTLSYVVGAWVFAVPTWDVGVSLLMSVLCWLLAPLAVPMGYKAVKNRERGWWWRLLVSMALIYFVASGSYEIYNTIRMGQHPVTYWENLWYSVPVAIIAGVLWSYDGTLRELIAEVRAALRTK